MINEIYSIKKKTLIMELVGTVLALTSFALGLVILLFGTGLLDNIIYYFSQGIFSDTYGGYEIFSELFDLNGALLITLIAFLLIGFGVIGTIVFLIPTISGKRLLKQMDDETFFEDIDYQKPIRTDSIIKLILNAIPCLLIVVETVASGTPALLIMALLPAIVCYFEIKVLNLLKKE